MHLYIIYIYVAALYSFLLHVTIVLPVHWYRKIQSSDMLVLKPERPRRPSCSKVIEIFVCSVPTVFAYCLCLCDCISMSVCECVCGCLCIRVFGACVCLCISWLLSGWDGPWLAGRG